MIAATIRWRRSTSTRPARERRSVHRPGQAPLAMLAALLFVTFTEVPVVSAVTVTQSTRTVQSRNFIATWSSADQEALQTLRWHPGGSPSTATNVTASSNVGQCPAPFAPEYWGNSWTGGAPQNGEPVLVGLGTETPPGEAAWTAEFAGAEIHSQAGLCPQPFVALAVPVTTDYRFFDDGPQANVIKVTRAFDFQVHPLNGAFRPYMPRLSRSLGFDVVIYPTTTGALRPVNVSLCPLGCVQSDWDAAQGWFAIHNPTTGRGVIVRRAPNGATAQLFIDWDGASFTNASSFRLLPPTGGFATRLSERMAFCFYDNTIWSATNSNLPAGCVANDAPTADAGADQPVAADAGCQGMVTLNATGSTDPEDDALTFTWSGHFGTVSGSSPTVPLRLGTHTVAVTVEDPYGETASDAVEVTVLDTTAPVLGDVPSPVTLEQAGPSGTPLELTMPSAADNCGSVIVSSDAPSVFPPGTTTVTFTARDLADNTSTATTMVTVVCCRLGLTVNKPAAHRGEWVMLTAFIRNSSSTSQSVTVQLELTSPIKNKLATFPLTLPAETNKSHTLPLRIFPAAPLGSYTVKLTTVTGAGALETMTVFEVLP